MQINRFGSVPQPASSDSSQMNSLGGVKVHAPRLVQTPQEMAQTLHKLGDFLKNALLEIHTLAFGPLESPLKLAPNEAPAFSSREAAQAAQAADDFLLLHEKTTQ